MNRLIINNKIQEFKLQQINNTDEDNKKLKNEYKKILFLILALLSSNYIQYSSNNFRTQKLKLLKDIEKELIKNKRLLEINQGNIITESLSNNFISTYNSHFDLLIQYYKNDAAKKDFTKNEINKIIQAKFYDKTLNKRIDDNTSIIFNRIHKEINDSLRNNKPLEDTIFEVDEIFNITMAGLGQRLLVTENTRIFTQSQDSVLQDFNIDYVMWCADFCKNTCSYCAGMDGEIFPINDKSQIPAHSNCNCYWEII